MGYDDNLKSVLYYNVQTKKILTSRNFVFLTAHRPEPEEEILVRDEAPLHEGKHEDSAKRACGTTSPSLIEGEQNPSWQPVTGEKRKVSISQREP